MLRVCKGCGYQRKESDDLIPDWQCPNCEYAYNKLENKGYKPLSRNVVGDSDANNLSFSINKSKVFVYGILFILVIAFLSFGLKNLLIIGLDKKAPESPYIQSTSSSASQLEKINQPIKSTLSAKSSHQESMLSNNNNEERTLAIKAEIFEVEKRITVLNLEKSKYSGGLVLAMLNSSESIEKQTLAMLKQKESSWLYGIDLDYTIDGKAFTLNQSTDSQLSNIEIEIDLLERRINASEANARQYSSGLVQATLLSTNATQQQTLAMLQQKRLALVFALPQYIGFNKNETNISQSIKPNPVRKKDFQIISIDSKFTEKNETWWKIAWILKINNRGSEPEEFIATIEFLDSQGFVIDDDIESGLYVLSGETKTFTGYELVTASVASKIVRTNAKVRVR